METIYVDTSVFGGCFEKEFANASNNLLNKFKRGEKRMMYSSLVQDELLDARKEVKDQPLFIPSIFRIYVRAPRKSYTLATIYLKEGALGYNNIYDAMHIATATLKGADILASWNFKYMVNEGKIKRYNAINKDFGFKTLAIKSPIEIINS